MIRGGEKKYAIIECDAVKILRSVSTALVVAALSI